MKTLLQLLTMLLLNTAVYAQQYYFAYVQTDNRQPFYLKMNDKMLSSSASGYVVIPKLSTGNYTVTFGFPKEQFPQQTIILNIANADAGFLLKDFGSKGWGLYNLETMQVVMNNISGNNNTSPVATSDDVFTNALAGAANTELTPTKIEKPATAVVDVPKTAIVVKEEIKIKTEVAVVPIKKIKSVSDVDGESYTYVDLNKGSTDTINVFIPVIKTVSNITKEEGNAPVVISKVEPVTSPSVQFLNIDMQNTAPKVIADKPIEKTSAPVIIKSEVVRADKPLVSFNSDCKAMASENDFLKTRKKMAASESDDAMVEASKKTFKSTCFSVEQIKNLSTLFLNDAGKYNFFDAAYPHIYDSQNFGSLQAQLSDEYYISRFKAMIRN